MKCPLFAPVVKPAIVVYSPALGLPAPANDPWYVAKGPTEFATDVTALTEPESPVLKVKNPCESPWRRVASIVPVACTFTPLKRTSDAPGPEWPIVNVESGVGPAAIAP